MPSGPWDDGLGASRAPLGSGLGVRNDGWGEGVLVMGYTVVVGIRACPLGSGLWGGNGCGGGLYGAAIADGVRVGVDSVGNARDDIERVGVTGVAAPVPWVPAYAGTR